MSSPGQEHFQANITITTYSKYDVILYYSNCMTFASESVFHALNIITILNIPGRTQRGDRGQLPPLGPPHLEKTILCTTFRMSLLIILIILRIFGTFFGILAILSPGEKILRTTL